MRVVLKWLHWDGSSRMFPLGGQHEHYDDSVGTVASGQ